jgi:hypothetical protein
MQYNDGLDSVLGLRLGIVLISNTHRGAFVMSRLDDLPSSVLVEAGNPDLKETLISLG